jgi:pyruvate kinase
VQTPDDCRRARIIARGEADVPLVAKIERPHALEHLDAILAASDGVMVARGDLGLECPLEQIPRIQKSIIARARTLGRPAILATQVLESMRTEPRPTRAEVSDAATPWTKGVDAIMLAGETAAGRYPVRAVQTLDSVIRDAETVPASGALLATDAALEGLFTSAPIPDGVRHVRRPPRPRHVRSGRHARHDRAGGGDRRRDAARQDAQLLSSLRPRASISP